MSRRASASASGWDWIRATVSQDWAHDSEQLEEMVEAVNWFERMLGEDWEGWAKHHPLASQFRLTYGRAAPEGVRLRRLACSLEGDPGLKNVVTRLGNAAWRDYYAAMTELEAAGSMRTTGLRVELVEPSRGQSRTPDFRARLHDRSIAFECTALVESEPERKANYVFDRLFGYPMTHPSFEGAVIVRLQRGAAAAVDAFERVLELEQAIKAAALEKRPVPVPGLAVVEPIVGAHGSRTVTVDGALIVGLGDKRMIQLGRSLRKKLERGQLAHAECGVVVVRVDAFSFFSQGDLRTCVEAIAAFLYQCLEDTRSDVSAVLVYEKWRGGPEERFTIDDGWFVASVDAKETGSSRFVVVTHNPAAERPLTDEEATRLLDAALRW